MTYFDDSFPVFTGDTGSARSAYEHYCTELLGYGPNLRALFTAADEMPDCILLNANAACLHLAFEGREGWDLAKPYLARALARLSAATRHETLFCAAISSWADRDFVKTFAIFEQIAREWPADLIALKWGQYHAFNLGDQAGLLRLGQLAVRHHADKPYIQGLLAFALEQTHHLVEAEHHARQAVEIALDDAWAHHALAHVMETQGRHQEGAGWMAHCAHIWDAKGTFIREHNWWHTALFHLHLGQVETVFEVFDKRLWGEWPEFPQEQIGAASMLWRLQLEGIDVGERWQPVAQKARERACDHLFAFHDLHYLFALTQAGEEHEIDTYIDGIEARVATACPATKGAWQQGALPAAYGIRAFAKGDFDRAAGLLETALPSLDVIGGSHAQRDVFRRTLMTAQTRSNALSRSAFR